MPALRPFLRKFQGDLCYLCGRVMRVCARAGINWLTDTERLTLDHVRPYSAGGRKPGNSLLACKRCNNGKRDRAPFACEIFYAQEAHRAYAAIFDAWWRAHTHQGRRLARFEASQRKATG